MSKVFFKEYCSKRDKQAENKKIVIWRRKTIHEGYERPEEWRKNQSDAHKARWQENKRIREEHGVSVQEAWEILAQVTIQSEKYRRNEKMRDLWAQNRKIREDNNCSVAEAWEILRIKRNMK